MPSLNKVTIIGNVGSDPEMRFTPNGKPVTTFSVATNWVYTTPEGERKQETEWFNIVAWNKLAEQCNQFLGKGRLIYAEGRLHTRAWEGQDGQQHSRSEVIANRVVFLDRREAGSLPEDKVDDAGGRVDDAGGRVDGAGGAELEPDDIPF